jgi:hypothetical protein
VRSNGGVESNEEGKAKKMLDTMKKRKAIKKCETMNT